MTRWVPPIGVISACIATGGCETAASFDISGSYFPGWLVCSGLAIALAVVAHVALRRLRIEPAVPVVAYPALVAALTFAQWLIFLR